MAWCGRANSGLVPSQQNQNRRCRHYRAGSSWSGRVEPRRWRDPLSPLKASSGLFWRNSSVAFDDESRSCVELRARRSVVCPQYRHDGSVHGDPHMSACTSRRNSSNQGDAVHILTMISTWSHGLRYSFDDATGFVLKRRSGKVVRSCSRRSTPFRTGASDPARTLAGALAQPRAPEQNWNNTTAAVVFVPFPWMIRPRHADDDTGSPVALIDQTA